MREDIDFHEAVDCGVGLSKIAGQGLFALRDFQLGEVVVDYSQSSRFWRRCSFGSIPEDYKRACWWVGESQEIALLAFSSSLFMRANHSRDPNTFWDTQKKRLIAFRAISTGDEITYDYRLEVAPAHIKLSPPHWA